MPETYDLIIVGTGAGGGTLAYALRDSGMRILLIERGDYLPQEERTGTRASSLTSAATSPTSSGTTPQGKPFHPGVHYFVGGNTKVYGAALPRLRRAGFRGDRTRRRRLARLAHLLRRPGTLLRPRRAYLPRPRPSRRGPDRAPARHSLPFPIRAPRAGHRRPRQPPAPPGPPPLPHADGHRPARRRPLHPLQDL